MKKIAFATHVALVDGKEYDGIGNVLLETLSTLDIEYCIVRHSMEGYLPSEVQSYEKNRLKASRRLAVLRRPSPLRYLTEMVTTVAYFTFRKKVDVYVGVDPLNAFAAVILKKLHQIDYCVFYTPDYSPQRFGSRLLNKIYHRIDKYCVKNADEVWCVSTKIQEVRRGMGLAEAKNILIPNVPPTKFEYLQTNKHDKFALITYGIIDTQLDNEGALHAVAQLQKEYPKISLTFVGNGPDESRLKQIVKELELSHRVRFLGRKPLAETLELASKSGVGLALYSGEWEFNLYGDSTKCREFFYFGLPVVSTDTHATVQEIKDTQAGIIVEKDVAEYVQAIKKLLQNYDIYSKNARGLGQKYQDVHKKQILRLAKT